MRPLLIAVLMMSCAREEPRPGAEVRTPMRAARPPAPAPKVAAVDPRTATRRAAHDALAEHCGECHEGHRATAKPKALAVFDLDLPDWPARFDDRRAQSALGRLASKPAAARAAFVAFRDAERAARLAKPD